MVDGDSKRKWRDLLLTWKKEMLGLWERNQDRWRYIGLEDVAELRLEPPNHAGIAALRRRLGAIDPEVLEFYSVTNGWPIWLGSFGVGILPVEMVGLLSELDPEGYDIAVSTAPSVRVIEPKWDVNLSRGDLREAVLLTEYPAREMILSLATGEAVFYHFDGMEMFNNFYDYMVLEKEKLRRSFEEMLKVDIQ